jgi:molybdate transport system substrate-binding protein
MHLILVALLAGGQSVASPRAELTVLSAGAVEPALVQAAEHYRRETGDTVTIQFGTGPEIAARLKAGELPDLLIAPESVVERATGAGQVIAETRTSLGRVGVGVVTRRGVNAPAIGTVEGLKSALLGADSVVYNRASTGLHVERVLDRLGIGGALAGRTTRYANGEQVFEHLLKGKGNEIGFGALTEINEYKSRGLTLVGPLPPEIQNYTTYVAAVTTAARDRRQSERFVGFLESETARRAFAAAGIR